MDGCYSLCHEDSGVGLEATKLPVEVTANHKVGILTLNS
jgi:hypothetical protein